PRRHRRPVPRVRPRAPHRRLRPRVRSPGPRTGGRALEGPRPRRCPAQAAGRPGADRRRAGGQPRSARARASRPPAGPGQRRSEVRSPGPAAMKRGRLLAVGGAATAMAVHAAPLVTTGAALRRRYLPALAGLGSPGHVALTFDDGPDPASTPAFLTELE